MIPRLRNVYARVEPIPILGRILRALRRRYRFNYGRAALSDPVWGRILALSFSLPGLARFYLPVLRLLLAWEDRNLARVRPKVKVDCLYQLGADRPEPSRTLRELMSVSNRQIAFEIYRNALRVQVLRVVSETLHDYAISMALSTDEIPAWRALQRATEGVDLKAKYVWLLENAIDYLPDFAEARYELGCELRDQGRLDESLVHFRLAVSGQAVVVPGAHDLPVIFKAHLEVGKQLLEQGKLEEAVKHLERAARPTGKPGKIADADSFPAASRILGEALRRIGRYSEAAEHFGLALVYRPTLPDLPAVPLILQYSEVEEQR